MLVDADPAVQDDFKSAVEETSDFTIVKICSGEKEALTYYEDAYPDVIITELNYTQGNSLNCLFEIREKEKELPKKSYIVVITYVTTPVIMRTLYSKNMADFVFSKSMEDFRAELVLSHLNLTKDSFNNGIIVAPIDSKAQEPDTMSPQEYERRMRMYLENNIINQLCIKASMLGRAYLIDAIIEAIKYKGNEAITLTNNVYPELSKRYKNTHNNIDRAITVAIEQAWLNTEQDILNKVYPVNVDSRRGSPTSKDFIKYCADKVKQQFG